MNIQKILSEAKKGLEAVKNLPQNGSYTYGTNLYIVERVLKNIIYITDKYIEKVEDHEV